MRLTPPNISVNPHMYPGEKAFAVGLRKEGWTISGSYRYQAEPRVELTNFKKENISDFSFSPDGKKIALQRGHVDSDIVLIRDVKP